MQEKEIMERCRLKFETHKAKLLYEDDRFFILDWRRVDGSVSYERLQTLPDNYTEGAADSHRYTAVGNGWTVDVIAHILGGLRDE